MTAPDPLAQDGTYPRPQLLRSDWFDLSGEWDFAIDREQRLRVGDVEFDRTITVPYPPESPASGVHETGFLHRVWYRRTFGSAELDAAGSGERVLLHFGAVDHEAAVWVNGSLVATHVGGQTPFAADISDAVVLDGANTVVVRAVDPPLDVTIPRGKQDWREEPHSIWYHRTTGIWQPVWLERVPVLSVSRLAWETDLPSASVALEVRLDGPVPEDAAVAVVLQHDGEVLASAGVDALGQSSVSVRLVLPRQRNGQAYEELLWSPARPTLVSASVSVLTGGEAVDEVGSYLGLRSTAVAGDRFLLNDRPLFVRSVLAQNYWPETHLAASAAMLKREVELILSLGFNAARIHQKAEDPRFLHWADRLGLMLWGETASAYAYGADAATALMTEWAALVERDRSHPSIVTWVPLNESWGVQHLAHDPRQRAFSRAIADYTRALDGTRPVISNDGWEHTDSDIWTVHDYESDPEALRRRYADPSLDGFGPAGRRLALGAVPERPVMLTEFGGVSLGTGGSTDWGYSMASDPAAFEREVTAIILAVARSEALAGFCYTQLTDTGQEVNGLLTAAREPKFAVDRIRAAVLGEEIAPE